jgi:hypothetical protein
MILRELGELLDGEPNPQILSDLRWGKGPFYVRYGGFAMRYAVNDRGDLVPAIVDAEGNLVPDRRDSVFISRPGLLCPTFLLRTWRRAMPSPSPTCRTPSNRS